MPTWLCADMLTCRNHCHSVQIHTCTNCSGIMAEHHNRALHQGSSWRKTKVYINTDHDLCFCLHTSADQQQKHPETRTAFVPVPHSKQMWASSIHSNMCCCCCCCIHSGSAGYLLHIWTCTARKHVSIVITRCKSPENTQPGSTYCGGAAAGACMGRVEGGA